MSIKNELLEKAERGDSAAALDLGVMLYQESDLNGAVRWWEVAANGGEINAARNLMTIYISAEKNCEKFLKWLRKMAELGDIKGKAVLSALLCHSHAYWNIGGFGESALEQIRDRKEGFQLIDEIGKEKIIACADSGELDYQDIHALGNAYFVRSLDHSKESFIEDKMTALEYQELALECAEKDSAPQIYIDTLQRLIHENKEEIKAREKM